MAQSRRQKRDCAAARAHHRAQRPGSLGLGVERFGLVEEDDGAPVTASVRDRRERLSDRLRATTLRELLGEFVREKRDRSLAANLISRLDWRADRQNMGARLHLAL